jgi:hypothetical protein
MILKITLLIYCHMQYCNFSAVYERDRTTLIFAKFVPVLGVNWVEDGLGELMVAMSKYKTPGK